ncbi:MAG: hypothetical protein ABIJ56_03325 [Pseudomonadota bacterium]
MKKVVFLAAALALTVSITFTTDRHVARAEGSGGTGGEVGELHGTWDPSEYYLYVPATYNPDVPIRFFATLHGDTATRATRPCRSCTGGPRCGRPGGISSCSCRARPTRAGAGGGTWKITMCGSPPSSTTFSGCTTSR